MRAGVSPIRVSFMDTNLAAQCVPERLSLKQQVMAELDALAPEDTIIASNSSSYSCKEILEGLELNHSRRVLSAHTCEYSSGSDSLSTYTDPALSSDWPPETTGLSSPGPCQQRVI